MASAELQQVIAMLAGRPPGESLPLDEYRAGLDRLTSSFPLPADVTCEPARVGALAGEWVSTPGARPGRTLLFLHGGAYVRGSIVSHRELVARLAREMEARALLVAYRLAPEHPHPAALEDALAAWRWLLAQGADPARALLAGDSAGGGLALATLAALRDAGDPLPAAGVLLSPWTDLSHSGDSVRSKAAVDPFCTPTYLRVMAERYLGGVDPRTPGASPLFAELHGLPPLLLHVGTAEVLLDDSTRVAERARVAGTDVTLDVWPDMVHVWHLFAHLLPEGREACERIGAWVRARLPG
jgi:acetyl esterase/lipase